MSALIVEPDRLRALRLERALSMAALGKATGLRPATIHSIEAGNPARLSSIRLIALALDVDPSAFTRLEGPA